MSDAATTKARKAYEQFTRHLDNETCARIEEGRLTAADLESPHLRLCRDAWEELQRLSNPAPLFHCSV